RANRGIVSRAVLWKTSFLSGRHGVAPSNEISHSIATVRLVPPVAAPLAFMRIRSSLLLWSTSAMYRPPTLSPSVRLMRRQLPAAADEIAQWPLSTERTSVTPSPSKSPNLSALIGKPELATSFHPWSAPSSLAIFHWPLGVRQNACVVRRVAPAR